MERSGIEGDGMTQAVLARATRADANEPERSRRGRAARKRPHPEARAERDWAKNFLDWRGLHGNFHVPTPSSRHRLVLGTM